MDTSALIREAKIRFQHQESKIYLREKYAAELKFTAQGGLWTASRELLAYLRTETQETAILLDNYEKPVKVNVKLLLETAEKNYNSVMENWHAELAQLSTKR
jgi:hypothetical protein